MEKIRKIKSTVTEIVRGIVRVFGKLYKIRFFFNLGVKIYNFGVGVYNLFPKYDKITGLDTELLVKNHSNKNV